MPEQAKPPIQMFESQLGSLYTPPWIKGDWEQEVSKHPLKKPVPENHVLRKLGRQDEDGEKVLSCCLQQCLRGEPCHGAAKHHSCKMGHCRCHGEKGWSGRVAGRSLTRKDHPGHWEVSELCFGFGEVVLEVL